MYLIHNRCGANKKTTKLVRKFRIHKNIFYIITLNAKGFATYCADNINNNNGKKQKLGKKMKRSCLSLYLLKT